MTLLLAIVTWASAATLFVNTPIDVVDPLDPFLSLREAVDGAAPGDTISSPRPSRPAASPPSSWARTGRW